MDIRISSDIKHSRESLVKILRLCEDGAETQNLLPSVLQQLSVADPVCKKLALWLVVKHGSQADLLLAVNSLTKDCQAPSPVTRGVALRALTQVAHSDFTEYSVQAVLRGLQDTSSYVRRIAVLGCAKLHHLQPRFVEERAIVDVLYGMIRDPDPIVVMNCLRSLDEILRNDGGVVINRNINNYLLNRIEDVPVSLLPELFQYLKKYVPKSETEIFDIMNICDSFSNSGCASVVVHVAQYFLFLTRDLPRVKGQVLQRASAPLIHFLSSGNPELTIVVLDTIEQLYIPDNSSHLQGHLASFLCKEKEPSYVKEKRISMLCHLVMECNVEEILQDFYMCSLSSNQKLAQCAVRAISTIAVKEANFLSRCLDQLLHLLAACRDTLNPSVFHALSLLDLRTTHDSKIHAILAHAYKSLQDDPQNVESSVLWLISEYGDRSEETCYVFEQYVNDFEDWRNTELCLGLVSAGVKLLLKQPAQFQHVVGSLFERVQELADFLVVQTATYYYNLMNGNLDATRQILLGE